MRAWLDQFWDGALLALKTEIERDADPANGKEEDL
jgi:hypothetical protein